MGPARTGRSMGKRKTARFNRNSAAAFFQDPDGFEGDACDQHFGLGENRYLVRNARKGSPRLARPPKPRAMLSITVLGSGSAGNCAVVATGQCKLLVDA